MEINGLNNNLKLNKNYYPISEIAYKSLKDLIVKCKFKGGDRLILNDLANKLNISITPIREALKQLEKDELIEVVPNKGAIVVNIFLEDVIEIYDIRFSLECLTIQLLDNKIDSNFLEALYKLYDESEKYLAKKNIVAYQYCNKKFHDSLVYKTGNKRLIKIMNKIRDHMSIIIFNNLSLEKMEKTREHSKEHLQILNALKLSDFTLAEKLIKEHVINAKEEILKNFKELKKIN
jgi:DNA-binding GntR family transcriptional regulator